MTMTISIEVRDNEKEIIGDVYLDEGSVGFRRCGVSFNPSQDQRVAHIKAMSAGLMEVISHLMGLLDDDDGDGKRCMATAMTHLESAQMFAVKGLFMKPPDAD